ncbi:hypothetical protein, partial [Sinorhizobium meliloti]|uniref:hypothetical protein n=1 Tax=Rhizobium meliloti TaxID=382 RepID=UPI001AEC7FFA
MPADTYRYLNTEVGVESCDRFSLMYETRPASREYLRRLDAERMNDNIDFYHMHEAYEVCIRGGPQVQAFLRERRFHLVASASTLFRRLAA